MESNTIYKVPYEAATLILNTKEVVIYYKSEPLEGISYKFATHEKALLVFEQGMDLMEYLERSPEFKENEIENAHKRGFELLLAE